MLVVPELATELDILQKHQVRYHMHVLLQFYQQMPWLPELAQQLGSQSHQTHVVRWGAVVASKKLQCLLSAPVRSICLAFKALSV